VRRVLLLGILIGSWSLILAACNGPASSLLSSNAAEQAPFFGPHASASNPTPIPFRFHTVDDPDSKVNAVTGINERKKISGVFEGGSASNIPESYTSLPPYDHFRVMNDPDSQGTYATGLSTNKVVIGYVMAPGTLSGIWGFVRAHNLWTLLDDSNEGTGDHAVTELLGVNGSEFGVGFYENHVGKKVPFQVDITTESFTELKPPGAKGAEATGINGKSDITGWEFTSHGVEGFYLLTGTYYPLSFPDAKATYPLSVNWQSQIAGYYLDSHRHAHGFVLTGPTRGGREQVWQQIDEPKASGGTWVTGINNHDNICGYYVDANGVQHGFVADP
jgi:hypothetical protein